MKNTRNIREPAVAGRFYEENPAKLDKELEKMLGSAAPAIPKETITHAIIMPHAGYVFSGKTAARTILAAKGGDYKRALIIAPSHMFPFNGLASSFYDSYETPLGEIKIDNIAMETLVNSGSKWIAEYSDAHAQEHSLEVELPFLQKIFPALPIVPFICGQIGKELLDDIASKLLPFMDEQTLWIISSDFTHFGSSFGFTPFPEDEAEVKLKALDMGAIDKILDIDSKGFTDYVKSTGATICGANPIKILLRTLELAIGTGVSFQPQLVEYTTSGALTGDYSHCVSYAGIAIFRKNARAA